MMALQGLALKYNEIIPNHHGENKLILPGAFDPTLNSGATVEFRLNNHDGACIGTTADHLQLFSDQNGLAFRMTFSDSAIGRQAVTMAESRDHTEMSIGFDYRGARKMTQRYSGIDVIVIIEARLYEITFLNGYRCSADRHAFAWYENVGNKSLRDDCLSGKMLCDGAAVGMRRAFRNLMSVS